MEGYEESYHTTMHNELYRNKEFYKIKARLSLSKYFKDVPKKSKILEFGCGLGQNIYLLPNAIGYDISKFALKFCKKKGIKTITSLSKAKNASFDVVFSAHVLEHLERPFETLKILKKKLKKNGKLILILPFEKHERVDFNMDINQHLYCWNFRAINSLLIKVGFKVVDNRILRGLGYKLLLPLKKINFNLYKLFSTFLAYIFPFFASKEIKIIAVNK